MIVQLPQHSELVTDADEEVFILYSNQRPDGAGGLGHVDSRKDTLTITFDLKPPLLHTDRSVKITKSTPNALRDKTVQILLAQDKTALRTRKGDTGSVLWRASIDFAQVVLQQQFARDPRSLFDPDLFAGAHILELGSGTGLLAVAFSPLVAQYTITDIPDLIPLIRKNLALNFDGWPHSHSHSNVTAEELDWILLHGTAASHRPNLLPLSAASPDIILALDCVYNPALLPSLVETIDFLSTPNKPAVVVVMELRQEDVVREFLELWLAKGPWQVSRVAAGFMGPKYVVWVGQKVL